MVSLGTDYELIDTYLKRRRQLDYTDKLLNQLLQDSKSFSEKSLENEETLLNLEEKLENSEFYRNIIESKENVSINASSKEILPEKPLEELFMVKSVQNWFNIRNGSFSEMVVNGFFYVFRAIFWFFTHPTTVSLFKQLGMKLFELFVAAILAGVMIMMSIVTCGKDLQTSSEKKGKGKEIVVLSPRDFKMNSKPSTSQNS